jgi:flagellar hook-associated protein 1 FlgK
MGVNNTGSLQLTSLLARQISPANLPVTIKFTGPNSYTRSDYPAAPPFTYSSGQPIEGSWPTGNPLDNWSLVLQGSPKNNDTFVIQDIANSPADRTLNGGNATAMMDLRDVPTFDGAAMSDGYAGMISQIGIRSQSAIYTAQVSTNIATNASKDVAGVSGVNLDEEAAKLLQYQQAYQASAKMIQIAQSIFDTLFQTIAR